MSWEVSEVDELLERLHPQFIELFLQPVFHRLDVVVGDFFDLLDPLGILRRKIPIEVPQRFDFLSAASGGSGSRQSAMKYSTSTRIR